MTTLSEIRRAAERITDHVRETPVQRAGTFEHENEVWLKYENLQLTGSFKLRGVFSKLLATTAEERAGGFLASSTGNHGAAVAHAFRALGLSGTIVVPETARDSKVEAIRALGGEVQTYGQDCVEAESFARLLAAERGMTYVSPYNDLAVVAGQGTVALELMRQLGPLDAVFAAAGGGGLVSGMAVALKTLYPTTQVIGVSPVNSPVLARSVEAGEILELASEPTLSDATAGGMEADSVTFPLARVYVDRFELVDEREIVDATRRTILEQHTLVEGAAGAAVAAYLREADRWRGKRVAIVLCGANVGADELREILG